MEKFNPNEAKEKIIRFIQKNGPSLPIQISKEINQTSWISSAFLSELSKERKLKISNLKVGGSPLYFIPGQENFLEKFYNFLNEKEKDAFLILKERKLLEDSKQEPAIRVALRSIKDFALPLNIKFQNQDFLFWMYFNFNKEEAEKIAYKRVGFDSEVKENQKEIIKKQEQKPETTPEKTELEKNQKMIPIVLKEKTIKKIEESEFSKKIRLILEQKNIEILELIESKKKETVLKSRLDTEIGKMIFLCVAKDKKSISDTDLTVSLQKSQSMKIPLLFVSSGKLSKKAETYLEDWKNLIKIIYI